MNPVALALLAASSTFNLPPGLLSAVCWVESSHRPAAYHADDNGSPSMGLCQIKEKTARWMGYKGAVKELRNNPITNAYYAAKYISYQRTRFHGNISCAISAYNQGNCKTRADGKVKNYYYVQKVTKAWREQR